jgi:hypothetical protein
MKSHLPPPSSILSIPLALSRGEREGEGDRDREKEKNSRERGRERERERKKREERVKFSDVFCVGICFRCDQSTDTLTVAFPCRIMERSLSTQSVHTHTHISIYLSYA